MPSQSGDLISADLQERDGREDCSSCGGIHTLKDEVEFLHLEDVMGRDLALFVRHDHDAGPEAQRRCGRTAQLDPVDQKARHLPQASKVVGEDADDFAEKCNQAGE